MRKIKATIDHRIETGALRINRDWGGLFVRGDDCAILRNLLLEYTDKTVRNLQRGRHLSNEYTLALKLLSGIADVYGEEKMIDF